MILTKIEFIKLVVFAEIFRGSASFLNTPVLVHLNLIFRHGARTPLKLTYPADPYYNYTYPPYGRGQLLPEGKRQAYLFGWLLRLRYGNFLGAHYDHDKFKLFCDNSTRVQETSLAVMASLWTPTALEQLFPSLFWQPVSYNLRDYYPTEHVADLLKYMYLFKDQQFLKERLEYFDRNITYIMKNGNLPNIEFIKAVHSTTVSQVYMGMPIPAWLDEVFPEPLDTINYILVSAAAYTKKLRTQGCNLLNEWIDNIELYLKDSTETLAVFYGAHDENIIVMLECLNIFDPPSPRYLANLALELYQSRNNLFVQVVYQLSLMDAVKTLRVPRCAKYCPWDQFKSIVNKHNG